MMLAEVVFDSIKHLLITCTDEINTGKNHHPLFILLIEHQSLITKEVKS